MSQLDLEQLEHEGEEQLAENQPAPGKATLTSRIGKPHRAGAGDLIDGETHAQLAGGLGVELSRGDGGNGGGGAPKKLGAAVGFMSGGRSDLAHEAAGDEVEERPAGRGLEFLGGASLHAQQRAVTSFDRAGQDDFYDARATVDPTAVKTMPDIAKTPAGPAPIPVPYPNIGHAPTGDLASQQRQVTQFDAAGKDDFYDQRATVDTTHAPTSSASPTTATTASPTAPAPTTSAPPTGEVAAPRTPLASQQREVAQFDRAGRDDFYDQRATVDTEHAPTTHAPTTHAPTAQAPTAHTATGTPPSAPMAPLASQQREVAQFDRAGRDDFYDQRATVDTTHAPTAPTAPALDTQAVRTAPPATTAVSGTYSIGGKNYDVDKANVAANATGAAGVAAAEQAANAAATAVDPAVEAAKTQAQTDAEKSHEAMHAVAGTAGGAVDAAQANAVAAQQKTKDETVGMINPDLKKPGQPHDDVPLNMINPDLKKPGQPGQPHDDVPLNMINPDLKRGQAGQPAKPGDVPLDATNPDLKKPGPAKPGDVPLDAINPDLKKHPKYSSQDVFIDPWDDEELLDVKELDQLHADPAHPKAPVDPNATNGNLAGLDAKVDAAKANPQQAKEQLKAAQHDATIRKGTIKQGVDAKAKAVTAAGGKSAAGAAAKGGKKVATVAGKGGAALNKAKGAGDVKKVEKAKNIEELKQRLEKNFKDEKTKLEEQFKTQKAEQDKLLKAEQAKIDTEMKAAADKIAQQVKAKSDEITKQIAEKKKAYDKQIAEDKKKAEKVCKDEQANTKKTTAAEVKKIETTGKKEADKVVSDARAQAGKVRKAGEGKAAAAINGANTKAAGIEDETQKTAAKNAGQAAASRARQTANAEAKQIEDAAKTESEKRKALTKQLADDIKAKGEKALHDLDAKLQQSIADINKKATDGLAAMEGERKKLEAEAKAFADKLNADHAKKNEEAKFKIHTLQVQNEEKWKSTQENALKGITSKHDDLLLKLEKGKAEDLAKLEEETNKVCGEIQQSVAQTKAAVDKDIKAAQEKAAFEAKKRVDAIHKDGEDQSKEIDKKIQYVTAKITEIDNDTKAALKKASEDAKKALVDQSMKGQEEMVAATEKGVADLHKSSADYEKDKKAEAEAEAARKKKEAEDKAKAEADKAAEEKKKAEEAKAKEDKEQKEFDAKTGGAAADLLRAMDRWGTDEEAVMRALKGKTPKEMAAIKKAYKEKCGRDLDADLKDELSGTDLKEAHALMSDDPVQKAVAQLQSANEAWFTDRTKIRVALAEITDPKVRAQVVAEYEKQTGQRLEKMLTDEGFGNDIKTSDYKRAEEEPAGPMRPLNEDEKKKSRDAVTELEGAMNRWGTDEAAVMKALKGKSPEEIAFIKDEFKRRNGGKTLDSVLEDEMSGTDLKEARALMSADPVQAAVAQLHNASDGIGTDKEKIIAALKDIKDDETRKRVAAEYKKQTGDDLNAMIKDEMSGMDGDLATALVGDETGKVNNGKVGAIEADKAMHGGFLTDISDSIADTVGADRNAMRSAVGGVVATVVLGPIAGPILAFGGGAAIGTDVTGTDEEALYKALENVPANERQALLDEYKKRTGKELKDDLKSELKPKEMDVTDAILAGDKTAAEAAKIAAAADGAGTDRKALYAALEGKSLEERRAIIAKFNDKYGKEYPETEIEVPDPANPGKKIKKKVSGFDAMCADELDDLDRQKAEMIAEKGKMDDGFALYYGMNEGFMGIGTDDALLKERLKGKSKKEIETIMEEYRKAKALQEGKRVEDIPVDALKTDIGDETSGRVGHELKQSLKGNPETPEEILQRAKEDMDFERHDSGWMGEVGVLALGGPLAYAAMKMAGKTPADISNAITDTWSDSGRRLEEDYRLLEAEYLKAKIKAETDPKILALPPDQRKKAIEASMMDDLKKSGQADYVEGSIKQFAEAKDATADAVGTAVAVAVGALITIASGGTAAPALVALLSGLAGVSAKMIMKGASMSNEELVQELAQVAAEALAAGFVNLESVEGVIKKVAGKFGDGIASRIIKEALEEAIESGSEELLLALLDENLYKGDLVDFAAGVGGRVGKAALTGAGAAVVSTGFGEVFPGMNKLQKWESKGGVPHGKAIAGAINQAVGSAFTTAIDPNTYNGSGADVALAFGKSMGSAALRGLQDGYSTSEGGFKPGPGWGKTSSHGAGHANAKSGVSGDTQSSKGSTHVEVETEVDVTKDANTVNVNAKATTSTSGADGNNTASESTSKTLPIDNKVDPNAKTQPTNQVDPNAKTQPIDVPVDTDPNNNKSTPLDGKQGSDPNSQTPVDPNSKLNASIEAAKQAHAGGDPKVVQAALQKLPGAGNIEVVADGFIGPLKPNQVPASTALKAIVMMEAAMKSKVGQEAVKALQDLGITLTLNAREGSFRQGNRINIDPTMASDPDVLAGILAHEVHHAKTFDKDVDINKSRDQYVAATLKNEAEAQAALFEHFQQTGKVDSVNAQRQFGAQEYFSAYAAASKAFAEANPGATAEQIHEAGKNAGIAALQAVFGNATPSTSVDENNQPIPGQPQTYADLYGQWHDAHSPVGLVAQQTGSPIPTSQQAAPAGTTPVAGPDPKLVALTEKAFDKYSAALGPAKALLQGILGKFGEVMARAKDPVSAANRLQRAIDNFGAKVTDVDSAISNIWDAIGTRVVVGNATPETMAQVVAQLQAAIESGQIKITSINNLHGLDGKAYFSADQIAALAAAAHAANGTEITTNASKLMAGGFTSVCIYVEYANGVKGEIQIIGAEAMKIANVEHIPYDIGIGKPLVRGIDSSLQGELNAITGPIEAAMRAVNADPSLKAAYEKYLSEMYAHARNLEMGIESEAPHLPPGLDQSLSVEGLQKVMAAIEALKAKQKALEAQKKADGDLKAPAPLVKVIPNPEADAIPPPKTKEELLAFALKKYGNVLDKYVGAPHTANPKFNDLLTELSQLEPGAWANNPEKADDALARWMAISKEIEAEAGKSEADLRELYGILEKTDMPRWLEMMEGKTDKEKAEALYEMRKQWRILVRDLMTDEKSKEILYLRDRALSGHRTGPALQDLIDRNLKKTNGDLDAAYRRIVKSAMESNKKVDKGILGDKKTDTDKKGDETDNQQTNENKNPKVPSPIVDPKAQAEENRRRVEESKKDRDEDFKNRGVDGEKGKHGGTEVHSHWLGVIKTDVFAEKYGGWKALLEAITKLENPNLRHTTAESGKKSITERGVAGDAMRIADEALKAVNADPPTHPRLKKALSDFAGDPAGQKAELERVKALMIEEAVRKCLEASPDTDFNSAYEIRDELIKEKFGGDIPRDENGKSTETKAEADARETRAYAELCRLTVQRLMEDGVLLTEQSNSIAKLIKRFSGEMLQDAIDANLREIAKTDKEKADRLAKEFRVRFLSMGLSINYGEQDRRWEGFRERFFSPEQKAELERRLDGVESKSERGKITRQFESEVEQTRWLGEMVKQFGYEAALKIMQGELDTLMKQQPGAMAEAKSGRPDALNENRRRVAELQGYIAEMQRSPDLQKIKEGVVARQEIVGIDMAGQELYEFSAKGKERFKMMYMALVEAAKAKGQVMVFRPHVGEGAINPLKGAVWNAFNKRWEMGGKPIHYQRAENNVESMIEVLQELQAEGLLDPKRVTVRFGHATHTNPEQAQALAKLGVIAEVNLGSNIATNVADQAEGPDGNKTKKAEEDFSDHSFLTLIFNQVQTILSTDGHAVEKTSMGEEYARAHKIIEDFLAGKMKVRVTMDQAEAGFPGRGTPKDGFVELGVEDLSREELDRFLNAYKQLHAWANQYRGTEQRGGTPIDANGNPIGSAQNPQGPQGPRSPAPLGPHSPAPVNNNQNNQTDPNNAVNPQQTTQPTQEELNKAELDRIRSGTPGVIRGTTGPNALTNADVVKSLNSQLQKVESGDVDKMVESFPEDQKEKAKLVLARATAFGKMESLNDLRKAMDKHLADASVKVFTPGKGSLADNIMYSQSKSSFEGMAANQNQPKNLPTTSTLTQGCVVILDPVVMAMMKDPAFVAELKTKQCVLLEPRGFSSINMFNTQTPDVIKKRTQDILDKANSIETASNGALTFDQALQQALSQDINDKLNAAGLSGQLEVVDPAGSAAFDSGTVARNLSGDAGMSEADLEQALDGLSDEQKNLARELLAQTGDVFSPRRFAQMMQEQHNKLVAQNAAIKPEHIYFLIPLSNKSYGMLAMGHREATGTPPDRYLNGPEDVRALQQKLAAEGVDQKNVLIIIFDDVAGSGDSLHQASADIGKGQHQDIDDFGNGPWASMGIGAGAMWGGKVIVSPMVSTEAAKTLFETNDSLKNADGLKFEPREMAKALTESAFFKGLDNATQIKLLDMCMEKGFGENRLAMSFPYMSPDNNSGLFWRRFAKYFIVNKNQKAAKKPTP